MTIDWFTFTAQILNFLVLVWLLKRFLYAPIVNAMDQREARIADRLTEAARAKEAADESGRQYQKKLDDLASTQEELMAVAGREVETWREEHLRKAKDEADGARTDWRRTLAREKQSLLRQLQLDGAHHAMDIGRHLLMQLADEQLESRFISQFLKHLADADKETLKSLESISHDQTVQIESSHEIGGGDGDRITAAIRKATGSDVEIEFRVNSDLLCGIELRAPGCKLAWSFRECLAELESDLIDSIDQSIPSAVTEPVDAVSSPPELATDTASPAAESAR